MAYFYTLWVLGVGGFSLLIFGESFEPYNEYLGISMLVTFWLLVLVKSFVVDPEDQDKLHRRKEAALVSVNGFLDTQVNPKYACSGISWRLREPDNGSICSKSDVLCGALICAVCLLAVASGTTDDLCRRSRGEVGSRGDCCGIVCSENANRESKPWILELRWTQKRQEGE